MKEQSVTLVTQYSVTAVNFKYTRIDVLVLVPLNLTFKAMTQSPGFALNALILPCHSHQKKI